MNRNILKFVLVISLLLNFSMLLSAGYSYYKQSRYSPPLFCDQAFRGGYLVESVGLRPEQRDAVRAKAQAFHSDIEAARKKIVSKHIELISLLRSDSPDPQAIRGKIDEIGKLQGEIQRAAAGHMLEVKDLLDKDQQNKFFDLIQDAMRSRAQVRGPW